MNRLDSLKLVGFVICIFWGHGFKFCLSSAPADTAAQDDTVTYLSIGSAKTVHCIDLNKNVILHCRPKHSLIFHTAQWSNATCEYKKANPNPAAVGTVAYHTFDRTDALQQLCDGLTHCFLRPSKGRHGPPSTFLGDPIYYHTLPGNHDPANYSLTVSVSCVNLDLNVKGRKVIDTFVSKENDVDFGCNDEEEIHLALARVDGYAENGPNRTLKEYNFGHKIFSCNYKQKCKLPKEVIKLSENDGNHRMVFEAGVLVYYCRKPLKLAFCDHVKHKDTSTQQLTHEFVLYAEQDSQVTVKAPLFNILKAQSAFWSTSDKLADVNVRKNRLDLVKFICDNRNYCVFTPKRSAAGALDTSFEEVHFGGIVDVENPLVLLARFKTTHLSQLPQDQGIKSVKINLNETLSLKCLDNEEGTLHVLSAVAGPKDKTDQANSVENPKFKDLTKVIYKMCYRKRSCEWNLTTGVKIKPPAKLSAIDTAALETASTLEMSASSKAGTAKTKARPAAAAKPAAAKPTTSATPSPSSEAEAPAMPTLIVPVGLENHELTVKYMCKKYTHDPSLVDLLTGQGFSGLELAHGSENLSNVDKEQAEVVQLTKGSKVFINIEVLGETTVKVGEFFVVKLGNTEAKTLEAYFEGNQQTSKISKTLKKPSTKYVFYMSFLSSTSLEFAADASDGLSNEHFKGKLVPGNTFKLPVSVKDVVKATGAIVGMRVYLSKL